MQVGSHASIAFGIAIPTIGAAVLTLESKIPIAVAAFHACLMGTFLKSTVEEISAAHVTSLALATVGHFTQQMSPWLVQTIFKTSLAAGLLQCGSFCGGYVAKQFNCRPDYITPSIQFAALAAPLFSILCNVRNIFATALLGGLIAARCTHHFTH